MSKNSQTFTGSSYILLSDNNKVLINLELFWTYFRIYQLKIHYKSHLFYIKICNYYDKNIVLTLFSIYNLLGQNDELNTILYQRFKSWVRNFTKEFIFVYISIYEELILIKTQYY